MSKTMAEVIRMHSPIGRDEDGQYCKGCNHRYGYAAERELHIRACAHIDQELSAAGFGLVADAKAEAWDEGYNRGTDLAAWAIGNRPQSERPDTDNPYRAVS